MRRVWHRLGRVPSVVAAIALYGLLVPAALILHSPIDQGIAVALLGLFTLYCAARAAPPRRRVHVRVRAAWLGELDRDGEYAR